MEKQSCVFTTNYNNKKKGKISIFENKIKKKVDLIVVSSKHVKIFHTIKDLDALFIRISTSSN